MSQVTLKHVYKVYEGGVRAVNDFDLAIKDKEFIVFVGPSGCGKSTTLRMIAGLESITAGELYIDDALVNDVDSKDRDIAMVFQNYALYPHMTVYQNIAFGLKLRKEDPAEIDRRVKEAAEVLEITDLLSRKPKALSGGQRQRVALGRAIVREPKVFLLDEPLSNLDAKLRVQMRSEITKLHKRLATTFIYVTHDQTEAMTMGDRIVVMKLGYIQQVDTPMNLYENPANLFVATFLGSPQMNIINCRLEKDGNDLCAILNGIPSLKLTFPELKKKQLASEVYLGKEVDFGIRPEHIRIASEGLPAHVEVVERLGDEIIVYAKIEGQNNDVVIKEAKGKTYHVKDKIFLAPMMEEAHLFDKTSTDSIMGIPQENLFEATLSPTKVAFGENELLLPEEYRLRLLKKALPKAEEERKILLSFAVKDVSAEETKGFYAIPGLIDFIIHRTDSDCLYLALKGLDKRLVVKVATPSAYKEGEKLTVYVDPDKIVVRDLECNPLVSREQILDNDVRVRVKTTKGLSHIMFEDGESIVFPDLGVMDGPHRIRLMEEGVVPVFSKKQLKGLKISNPSFGPKRLIKAAAYDENQLGTQKVIFVKIPGCDHYASFVVENTFSVYKAPKFKLAILDDAIEVIE